MSLQNQVTRCRCQPVLPSSNQWNLASKRKLGKRHQNQPETLLATNFFGHSTQGSARVKQTPSRCHQPMTYGCRCNSKNIFAFDAIIGTAFWKKTPRQYLDLAFALKAIWLKNTQTTQIYFNGKIRIFLKSFFLFRVKKRKKNEPRLEIGLKVSSRNAVGKPSWRDDGDN